MIRHRQELTKRKLAVAVYNHYKRIYMNRQRNNEVELANRTSADRSDRHRQKLAGADAGQRCSTFRRSWMRPSDRSRLRGPKTSRNIILKLLQSADGDVGPRPVRNHLYDEIDKIGRKDRNQHHARCLRRSVQQACQILKGHVATYAQGGRKHPHQEFTPVTPPIFCYLRRDSLASTKWSRRVGRNLLASAAATRMKKNTFDRASDPKAAAGAAAGPDQIRANSRIRRTCPCRRAHDLDSPAGADPYQAKERHHQQYQRLFELERS